MKYIHCQVDGGGPIFNAPDTTDEDVVEDVTWYDILSAAVGA